jgi:hypothetical protein
MKIEERIVEHEIRRQMLMNRIENLRKELEDTYEKIMFHEAAIKNLEIKKHKND